MTRLTAKDFDQRVLDLFDGYVHGKISRRGFLDGASKYAVGGMTAAAMLEMLSPKYAFANQVAPDDPSISGERVSYESPEGHGTINAYFVKPAGLSGQAGGVVVVHENRGLNPYIEDVARRVAKAGFLALAPDGLSPLGGYPGNDDEGREMQAQLDRPKLVEDFIAAYHYLKGREECTGSVGAVGFCFGGGVVNTMAVRLPELAAAVPFYGRQPAAEDVPQIEAPLLIHYAGLDERINEGAPAYREALEEHNKQFEVHIYEGVNHGFHNDTTPRYDEEAATLAWERTVNFFNQHL